MLRSLPVLLAFCCAPAFAANQVHTVGAPGTADFFQLQAAVDAAADGDILLVRYGQYIETTIDGKGLTLIGLASPDRPQVHQLTIRNTTPAQRVVVRGIDSLGMLFALPYFARIEACLGPVTFEDCQFEPSLGFPNNGSGGEPFVQVESSPRVVFSRCTFTPAPAIYIALLTLIHPSLALRVVDSDVYVYDSILTGAAGVHAGTPTHPSFAQPSSMGNAALELVSGSLLLAGCTVTGGRGGDGSFAFNECRAASDGSPGLLATGGVLRLMDTVVQGGAGGTPAAQCPGATVAGPPMVVTGASLITINETLRRFELSSPAFEGNIESTTFTGVPGEPVLLLISVGATNLYVPGIQSMLHPGIPFFVISLGLVPPTGTIAFTVALPQPLLPAGIEGLDLFEQCVVPGNSGFGLLSAPSVRTVFTGG